MINLDHDIMLIEWVFLQAEKELTLEQIKSKYLEIQREVARNA